MIREILSPSIIDLALFEHRKRNWKLNIAFEGFEYKYKENVELSMGKVPTLDLSGIKDLKKDDWRGYWLLGWIGCRELNFIFIFEGWYGNLFS